MLSLLSPGNQCGNVLPLLSPTRHPICCYCYRSPDIQWSNALLSYHQPSTHILALLSPTQHLMCYHHITHPATKMLPSYHSPGTRVLTSYDPPSTLYASILSSFRPHCVAIILFTRQPNTNPAPSVLPSYHQSGIQSIATVKNFLELER